MPHLEPSSSHWRLPRDTSSTQRHQHAPKAFRAVKARSSSRCCSAEPGAARTLQEGQHSLHHSNSTPEAQSPGGCKGPPETSQSSPPKGKGEGTRRGHTAGSQPGGNHWSTAGQPGHQRPSWPAGLAADSWSTVCQPRPINSLFQKRQFSPQENFSQNKRIDGRIFGKGRKKKKEEKPHRTDNQKHSFTSNSIHMPVTYHKHLAYHTKRVPQNGTCKRSLGRRCLNPSGCVSCQQTNRDVNGTC